MTLEELRYNESLSVRTYNVCRYSRLNTLKDILLFYQNNKTFKNIRNCGSKSETELLNICKKYLNDGLDFRDYMLKNKEIKASFDNISQNNLTYEIFQKDVLACYHSLSFKARNTLNKIVEDDNFNVNNFVNRTIIVDFDFSKIWSCGAKTVKELNWFREYVKILIDKRKEQNVTPFQILIDELERTLGLVDLGSDTLNLIEKKELNILYLIDRFVLESKQFKIQEREIFNLILNRNGVLDDSELCADLGTKIGLSRERVRQLVVKFKSITILKFRFILSYFNYSFNLNEQIKNTFWKIQTQPLDPQIHFKHIKNENQTMANLLELFSNSKYFILSPTLKLKGTIGAYDQTTYKKFRELKVYYLVQVDFLEKDKILEILNDLYSILYNRITEDKVYDLSKYSLNEEQLRFVQSICSENFGLEKDGFERVILKRNTIITAPDIIEKILIDFDELMTAEEILEEYNYRFPNTNKEINSIRGALNNERFIFFRGSGVSRYGLKEWERERGLKSGNIKNMCIEFIQKEQFPVHIHKLTKYIQQYRNTNHKNVLTNLKLDNRDQFLFYTGGFIGMTNKNYPEKLIENYKAINPYDGNAISYFIKNHWYYDYSKTITKFCGELELMPDQVDYLIEQKVLEKILKIKNDKIYYNQVEEDSLYNHIFQGLGSKKDLDFNPYRIEIDNYKMICRVSIVSENDFEITNDTLFFTRYDIDTTDFRCLIFYHKAYKIFNVLIWRNHFSVEQIIGSKFYFSNDINFEIEDLNSDVIIFRFSNEKLNAFRLGLLNRLKGNLQVEKLYDLGIYNIDGLNKIQAYSKIIDLTEKTYNKMIDLVEAKEIYELILLNQI